MATRPGRRRVSRWRLAAPRRRRGRTTPSRGRAGRPSPGMPRRRLNRTRGWSARSHWLRVIFVWSTPAGRPASAARGAGRRAGTTRRRTRRGRRAARVGVQGLHDAPRVLDDREREDLGGARRTRDVEGKFAIQNIEAAPGVLLVVTKFLRERRAVREDDLGTSCGPPATAADGAEFAHPAAVRRALASWAQCQHASAPVVAAPRASASVRRARVADGRREHGIDRRARIASINIYAHCGGSGQESRVVKLPNETGSGCLFSRVVLHRSYRPISPQIVAPCFICKRSQKV